MPCFHRVRDDLTLGVREWDRFAVCLRKTATDSSKPGGGNKETPQHLAGYIKRGPLRGDDLRVSDASPPSGGEGHQTFPHRRRDLVGEHHLYGSQSHGHWGGNGTFFKSREAIL
jgi:hypothetical protein